MSAARRVVVTGAAGGMGRACARLLGASAELVLTDVAAPALEGFAAELRGDGYRIAGVHAGDLASPSVLEGVAGDLEDGPAFTLVHTAGLSPSQADWRTILKVNLVGTEALLRAVEPHLRPGSAAVLIASVAGHAATAMPDLSALLAEPLAPDFLDRMEAPIAELAGVGAAAGTSGVSYCYSKLGVMGLAERRVALWGEKGARIVTISPGLILTPMGRQELEQTPGTTQVADAAPVGRRGTPMDVALAVQFLASEAASFVTGTDLRLDGGSFAAMKQARAAAQG